MRKPILFFAGSAVAALAIAQVSPSSLLTSFGKAINDAKTVSSDFTFQTLTKGGPEAFAITLKKPNLVRIETPTQTIVADGKEITTYDKSEKTYFKQTETPAELKTIFAPEELHVFAGFFDPNAYKAFRSKDLGAKSVKGGVMSAVEATYDPQDRKVVTYLLNQDDKLARKAQIELDKKDPEKKVSMVFDTKSLTVNGAVPDSAFVFEPPADSRELTLAEINAGKWYYDLDEAKKAAQKSNKMIFVDFFATWCGPCKMLERECFSTEEFKKYSSKLVFCRIDVDAQPSVSQAYGITAMPTQDIMDKTGAVVKQMVGYGGKEMFFNFLSGVVGTP
jgi:thiol:disulfide interchange protein DsbD